MTGDWIKMRGGLLTNPKVIRMARFLAQEASFQDWWTRGTSKSCDESVYELCDVTVVTRVTVGSLLAVWSAANDNADADGFIPGITLFEVDEMAGVPAFGEAMQLVGWVKEDDDGVRFPNFAEHNVVGKQRPSSGKSGAQRTREWRERRKSGGKSEESGDEDGDVTVTSRCDVTVTTEKRREEKKYSVVPNGTTGDLPAADPPESHGTTTGPPQDSTGTHGASTSAPPDPVKAFFDAGLELLRSDTRTVTAKRQMLGKLRKARGDTDAMQVLLAARNKSDPWGYIAASSQPQSARLVL